MNWYIFSEFPLEKDLSGLNRLFIQQSIPHRFTEEGGVQRLWIEEGADLAHVSSLVEQFENGVVVGLSESTASNEASLGENEKSSLAISASTLNQFLALVLRVPLTIAIIVIGLIGYLSIALDIQSLIRFLHFAPFGYPEYAHQYWRLVTPAFLHFNVMHFIFNALMIWFVGTRLEVFMGRAHYFLLFLACAILSNIAQFIVSQEINFGGLSGVAYGYVFCNFVLYKRWPLPILSLPPAIYGFLLFTLALGFLGIVDLFIVGRVANWAHLGGLVCGLVYGILYCFFAKRGSSGS